MWPAADRWTESDGLVHTAQTTSQPATDIRSGRTPVTMAFNPRAFADDTDYERFALDRLGPHRVRIAEPGLIYHDEANPEGGRRGSMTVKGGTAVMGAQAREELRRSLRPLGFGAAYKILDMLVEHVLRANGVAGWRASRTSSWSSRCPNSSRDCVLPIRSRRTPAARGRSGPKFLGACRGWRSR
jgi:hypothetical protein